MWFRRTNKPNFSQKPARKHQLRTLFALLILVGALGFVLYDRQNLVDWWRLRQYQPPQAVAQLASQDTMTPYARKVFYVNKPAIEGKIIFNKNCPDNGGEQTIVLGCYHSDQNGIFLLDVTDPRLNGVEQVTAAHETLHAIYDRLSGSERQNVDTMLLDYYHNDLHDQRILDTIAAYQKSEPNDWVNEMHSVFGTEIATLPSGLEQYYKKYFTNRQQIAAYAAQYQAEFTSRQTAVSQDDATLASLKDQIDAATADLKSKQSQINSGRTNLMNLENGNNIAAYNAGVPAFNSLIDTYNTEVQSTQALISQYNQLVAARNAIALEENQLANDLNANSVAPIQK